MNMNEYIFARHQLISEEVQILTQTNTHLLLINKHGMKERIENNATAILEYIHAD